MTRMRAPTGFNAADVQGNIVRGYNYNRVRYLMLAVADLTAARQWLAVIARGGKDGIPAITPEEQWDVRPATCFNIGLTRAGLQMLGVSKSQLETFPDEFVDGMAARAEKIGDTGSSAPENWDLPFSEPDTIHLIASIHSEDIALLDRVEDQVTTAGNGMAFALLSRRDGWNFNGDFVHFGYHDNISQPRFIGIHDPKKMSDRQPLAPLGSVLLGYETEYDGLLWSIPQPDVLGRNGSFNAFRILEQDVAGFEAYLDSSAQELLEDPLGNELLAPGDEPKIGKGLSRHAALREIVAAKMCGRWRNGVPLALSPETPNPDPPVSLTDFDYYDDARCPFGAHMRRCNPRGGKIVQRSARHTRRLVRRGMPYGPAFNPSNPDDEQRGLLGNFIGANPGAQFEAVMCDWLNLGLQDPRITASNDPLLGANVGETSWFDIPLPSGKTIRLRGLPRFVVARGGAYTFLPSIPAIRYLASLTR